MKKPFWQKNVLRDMLERDYTFYLLILLLLLMWEAVQFLVLKTGGNPSDIYHVKLFNNTNVGMAFAVFAPFVIVWRLLSQYNSAEGVDVFYSLPTTRRSIFGSATIIAGAYLAVFLLAETAVMAIVFACSKYLSVDAGYFPTRIVLIATVFLFYYGLAMICFSLSSGGLVYVVLYGGWMLTFYVGYLSIQMLPIWRYLFRKDLTREMWYSQVAGKGPAKFFYTTERVLRLLGTSSDLTDDPGKAGTYFWQVIPWFLLIALACIAFGYLAFVKRRAERVEGLNKCRGMHIALQGALIWAMTVLNLSSWYTFQVSVDFCRDELGARGIGQIMVDSESSFWNMNLRYKLFPGDTLAWLSVMLSVAVIWEMIYQKSVYKFWKAWAGMLLGAVLIGLTQLYAAL